MSFCLRPLAVSYCARGFLLTCNNLKLRLPYPYIRSKPHPKQAAFLLYDDLEAFYGGAAGGGKSEALLMGALQYVDVPGYAALVMRRSYTDLALPGALMDRAAEWLKDTPAKWDRETHTWKFPSGASLTFGYIQTAADRFRYQSSEFQYIAWDEVTEFPTDEAYLFMFSRLRSKENMNVPLRVRSASNPVGPGTGWVRKRFLENEPPAGDGHSRLFLPATFHDNPSIDRESYLNSLRQLPEATQERLIEGSWESIDNAAFPHFDPKIHVVPQMSAPSSWRKWEAMDYGTTNPTAWLAAGMDEFVNTLIYGEYYKPGLIADHASRILTLRHNSWGKPSIALCDPSIQNRTGFGTHGKGETVHSEFASNGVYLVPANNDRRAGLSRMAEMLRPDPSRAFPEWHPLTLERGGVVMGSPRLFITENCANLIEQIKYAPLDEATMEVIDPFWESRHGHAMAAARYLCTARVFPGDVSDSPRGGTRTWNELHERSSETEWRQF